MFDFINVLEKATEVYLIDPRAFILGCTAIGGGIGVLAGIGTGAGQGHAAAAAITSLTRQPEMESKIRSTLIFGNAMAETSAIYGLVISIILIFTNFIIDKF